MAIAFGAAGTAFGASVTTSGAVAVAVPAGVVSGNLLLAAITYDCNTNPTAPAGWALLQRKRAATASGSFQPPTTEVWRKVSNGTEGASQTWTFSTSAWPAGRPDVTARMLSYTGTDTATPVEVSAAVSGTSEGGGNLFRAMPQLTTATPNGWLVTVWGLSGTTTSTGITPADTNRSGTSYNNLVMSVWDSNAALAAGTQAQRTASTNSIGSWDGDVGITLALKILPSAGAGVAQAQTAQAVASAYGVTSVSVNGPWDLCADDGLPVYTWAVDWPQTGLAAAGKILNSNPYPAYSLTGWSALHATLALAQDPAVTTGLPRNLHTVQVTPSGTDASGGAKAPHTAVGSIVPGQQYVADYWLYVPAGWANVQVGVDWLDASDALLSTSLNTFSAAPAATWYHLTATFIAPASASRGGVFSRYGSTPSSSTLFYVWGLLLMDPLQAETRMAPSPLDVVGPDMLSSGATWAYGRDQMRQISPAALGSAAFSADNSRRRYSPDVVTSPLNGNLDAARPMTGQVQFGGHTYPLFTGRIDDYNVHADINNRTVDFTFLDAAAEIQTTPVTTGLYSGIRTGDAVNIILDQVGWTGPRDIDPGATVMPWWWLDSAAAGDAVNDLVKSEGPPAVAYAAPDGTYVFRDRTHRLLREESLAEQGQYVTAAIDCAAPPVTGLSFTSPVTYSHGWRDIINSVTFQVGQRQITQLPVSVWSSTSAVTVATGQTVTLSAVASDPFLNAITPQLGTDYTVSGAGTLVVSLSQTNGLSTQIMLQAVSGDVVVTGMQLRAYSVPVVSTVTVSQSDPTSVGQHGTKSYPESAPWAGAADAYAIVQSVLAKYSQRRPLVQIRVVSSDPVHYVQVLQRTISDLIRITDGELGVDAEFYVEHLAHDADRMGWNARPPIHAVTLGCEQQGAIGAANPFTFDLRGAGFDQGVWDPPSSDDPTTVFIFDDPVQGAFNVGRLGT